MSAATILAARPSPLPSAGQQVSVRAKPDRGFNEAIRTAAENDQAVPAQPLQTKSADRATDSEAAKKATTASEPKAKEKTQRASNDQEPAAIAQPADPNQIASQALAAALAAQPAATLAPDTPATKPGSPDTIATAAFTILKATPKQGVVADLGTISNGAGKPQLADESFPALPDPRDPASANTNLDLNLLKRGAGSDPLAGRASVDPAPGVSATYSPPTTPKTLEATTPKPTVVTPAVVTVEPPRIDKPVALAAVTPIASAQEPSQPLVGPQEVAPAPAGTDRASSKERTIGASPRSGKLPTPDRQTTATNPTPTAIVTAKPVTAVPPVFSEPTGSATTGPISTDQALAEINPVAGENVTVTGAYAAPLAPGHAEAASAASANPIVAAPGTVAALAAQIVKKLEGRFTRFDVELHPADLGRVDVRVEIGAQGRLTAAMTFENPHAAAELRGRADDLQRALEQAGFDISGGITFNVAGDQGRQFTGQDFSGQNQSPAGGGQARGRAFEAALRAADDPTQSNLFSALPSSRRTLSGVDIRI